jgi:ligand-binding sensor domain-containing protein
MKRGGIGAGAARGPAGASRTAAVSLVLVLSLGLLAFAPPQEPLEKRLEEAWRWRFIEGPDGSATVFSRVRPGRIDEATGDAGLLALDTTGLVEYDGWTWSRSAGWGELPDQEVHDVAILEDGVLVVTADTVGTIDAAGQWVTLDVSAPGTFLSHICRRLDGSFDLAMNGRVVRAGMQGLRVLAEAPEGAKVLLGLARDDSDTLWCATDQGVHRQIDGGWILQSGVIVDAGKKLRLVRAASSGSHLMFLPETVQATDPGSHWDGKRLAHPRVPGKPVSVRDVAGTEDGAIVVATGGGTLAVYRDGAWRSARVPLPGYQNVSSLCFLSGDRLAAVFSSGRLGVCDLGSTEWQQIDTDVKAGPSVNDIEPSARGGIWLATDEGIVRWDGEQLVDAWTATPLGPLSKVTTICEDAAGDVWIGSGSFFAGALRLRGSSWTLFADEADIGHTYVHSIDRFDDELWFTLIGDLVNSWTLGGTVRLKGGDFTRYTLEPDGAPLPRTYDLLRRRDGTLLAGMTASLRSFDGQSWRPLDDAPLDNRTAFALHEAADGALWVGFGLRNPGVNVLRDGLWERLDKGPWQRAGAASFAETADGRLWIASEKGLFRVTAGNCYDVSSQLPSRNYWPLLSDGVGGLWVGTLGDGLLHYRPDDFDRPKVNAKFDRSLSPEGDVVLRFEARDRWNATPPDELRFEALLDDRPVEVQPGPVGGRQIVATGLPPGRHLIEIAAIDGLGNRSEKAGLFEFDVPPPRWRSTPVLLAAAATTIALL